MRSEYATVMFQFCHRRDLYLFQSYNSTAFQETLDIYYYTQVMVTKKTWDADSLSTPIHRPSLTYTKGTNTTSAAHVGIYNQLHRFFDRCNG